MPNGLLRNVVTELVKTRRAQVLEGTDTSGVRFLAEIRPV